MDYKEVSCKFVEYYYGTFNKKYQNQVTQRENLGQLYNAESLLSYRLRSKPKFFQQMESNFDPAVINN